MGQGSQRRTYVLFTVLAGYIVLQFVWWAVLLVRKDKAVESLEMEVRALGGSPTVLDHSRSLTMIVGEGVVFLLIVITLLFFTWRAIRRDLGLARYQRNFLLAVTHELRSPIAGIKLQLQTLGRAGMSPEIREQLRIQAVKEADRLTDLTEKVLQTTSSEERSFEPELETVELMGLLHEIVESARAHLAPNHGLMLEGPDHYEVETEPRSLRAIIENLIENAAKYSREGTMILVEVDSRREGWRFSVCDEGPGIAEEDRERIFEQFYRAGNEETRRTRGTGLGLYIVRRLVRRLGGSIKVKNRSPQGSIFVASFPNH